MKPEIPEEDETVCCEWCACYECYQEREAAKDREFEERCALGYL
jgi:hypothetical protein